MVSFSCVAVAGCLGCCGFFICDGFPELLIVSQGLAGQSSKLTPSTKINHRVHPIHSGSEMLLL